MTESSFSPPNVVLINADDLGWTDLGVMGSAFYETPHIDDLAKEGRIFTNAYAAAPNCAPSRACMMTGRFPNAHGVYTVGNPDRGQAETRRLIPAPNQTSIPDDLPTMGDAFSKLGYVTGTIGKWHLSDDPLENGFQENVAGNHRGSPKSYFSPYQNDNLADGPEGEYLPERLAGEASDFIRRHQDERFFLYFPTFLVHTPIQGKDEVIEKYKQKMADGLSNDDHNNPVYAAMVEALDHSVGTVLRTLKECGIEDDTLVIFISDNGGIRAISKQTPLRAGKGSLYEGGVRVPLVIRWPGKMPAGSTSTLRLTNMDFFPSLLELCGGKASEYTLDGGDVSEALCNPVHDSEYNRSLFWHFPAYLQAYKPELDDGRDPLFRTRPATSHLKGPWKLLHFYEDDAVELYNIEEDLGERVNRASEFPERVRDMLTEMKEWLEKQNMPIPRDPNPVYDPQLDQKLQQEVKISSSPETLSENEWYRVLRFID